ncbi:MAG: hypothetical protein PHY54_12180 [Methylococcales bacterium]|nr:hypothetical protein [Methylococcales bacterium]
MNNNPLFKLNPLCAALAGFLSAGLFAQSAQAAVRTWDGNGANNNWGYVQNLGIFPGNTNWTDNSFYFAAVEWRHACFPGNKRPDFQR